MDLDLAVQETRPAVPGEDFAFTTTETDAAFLVLAHLPGNYAHLRRCNDHTADRKSTRLNSSHPD